MNVPIFTRKRPLYITIFVIVIPRNDVSVRFILGYNDILLIPAGATNIHIQEKEASKNYIG